MTRRSTPQSKIDEGQFPIRMRVIVPALGFGRRLNDMSLWLKTNIGLGNYAWHAHGKVTQNGEFRHCTAFYFRSPEHVAAFAEAFPEIELADKVNTEAY